MWDHKSGLSYKSQPEIRGVALPPNPTPSFKFLVKFFPHSKDQCVPTNAATRARSKEKSVETLLPIPQGKGWVCSAIGSDCWVLLWTYTQPAVGSGKDPLNRVPAVEAIRTHNPSPNLVPVANLLTTTLCS